MAAFQLRHIAALSILAISMAAATTGRTAWPSAAGHRRQVTADLDQGGAYLGDPGSLPTAMPAQRRRPKPRWRLVWSDEFNAAAGAGIDTKKWEHDTGGGGWGNDELQSYTSRTSNVSHNGAGQLVITARHETYTGADGIPRNYTSARIKTAGKFITTYGRIESRIRIPIGKGIWPTFWMLGHDIGTVNWPGCGEIDILENLGHLPSTVFGALHGPGYSGSSAITARYELPSDQRFADGFHTFAVEWEPDVVRWYVDGVLYATRTPASLPSGARWVYDHSFFIILNIAVGGNWPGSPDPSTVFPQTMTVEYVRVYRR